MSSQNLNTYFSGSKLDNSNHKVNFQEQMKQNSYLFNTPQQKKILGYIRENNYNIDKIPKVKNAERHNSQPKMAQLSNIQGRHYINYQSNSNLHEEINEQSSIHASQRLQTDQYFNGNATNRSLSTTYYQHNKQWGVSEGKTKLIQKQSNLKEYQDHRNFYHQSTKRVKIPVEQNLSHQSVTKSYGFFDKFAKQNKLTSKSMNQTQNSNINNNNNYYDYNQPQATFNDRIQGDKTDKKVGLLSNLSLKQDIQNKTMTQFNSGITPKLQNLRDELYKEDEYIEDMPSDIRIKSELFINQQYKNLKSKEIHQKQENQSTKLFRDIIEDQKNHQKIDKFIQIKKHKPPQIGEDLNQIEITKKNNKLSRSESKKQLKSQHSSDQNNKNELLLKQMASQPSLNVHIRYYDCKKDWHPQGRIGCTLSAVNGHLFLIGGRLNELISDVSMIKIQRHHEYENKWMSLALFQKLGYQKEQKLLSNCTHLIKQQQQEEQAQKNRKLSKLQTLKSFAKQVTHTTESKDEFTGRFNHTACVWKKYIVVFGGEQEFDQRYKKRSVLSELYFYDSIEQSWQKKVSRGDAVESRRNHTSVVLGNEMLVLGGLNAFEKIPNELVYLDLQELKWKTYGDQGNYKHIFTETGSLCYHTAVPVYEDPQRQKLHSDKNYQYHPLVREQGIYFYGGKFPNNKINNDVYLLNTFGFPVKWKKIQTIGKKPTRRYQHSMQYDQNQKVLIIVGGKTEQKDISLLNDIWILKMQNFQWMEINCINPDNLRYNSNFGCVIYDTQLFIFGGMGQNGFQSGGLEIHEYDQKRVLQIKNGKDFSKSDVIVEDTKELQEKKRKQGLGITYKSFQPMPSEIQKVKSQNFPRLSKIRHSIQQSLQYEYNSKDDSDSDEAQNKNVFFSVKSKQ